MECHVVAISLYNVLIFFVIKMFLMHLSLNEKNSDHIKYYEFF